MLNACPKCQRVFAGEQAGFCPEDATKLLPIDEVPIATDPRDPCVGARIAGRYELRRIVADGGMGRVYEGRQLDQERRIAVKILHPNIAEDAVNIERFKREAETSQSLDHRYIVDVWDFAHDANAPGRKDGAWYLVMEYLDGEELRALLDRQKTLPVARIVRITAQTAIALDGAHGRGAVHRDLKPENIFLVRQPDGDRVKLLDFGSVKFTKGQDRGQKLTVMGTTLGSPFYMSPEQARGVPDLDHRADVWALGCIIYEMLVGTTPFAGMNGPQILFKILGEEPMPPSFAKDDAPPQIDDVIVKALAKERADRYQSCGELADALGHELGLTGTHDDWAAMGEADLTAKLATAMAAPPVAHAMPATGQAMPFPTAGANNAMGGYSTGHSSPDLGGPPPALIRKPPVVLYVGLVAALLVVGLIVAFAVR